MSKRLGPAISSGFTWWLGKVLGRVTQDPVEQRNFFWINIANIGYYGAIFLCQTELLWTYIAKCGFSNQQIGAIGMYTSLAGSLGMFLFIGWPDRFRRRLQAVTNTGLLLLLMPLGVIVLLICYPTPQPHPVLLYGVTFLCVTNALVYSLSWMIEMTVFVRVIRENVRGRAWGMMGVAAAVINILIFTQIARWAQAKLAANVALIICLAMGAALWALRAVSYRWLRELPDLSVIGARPSASPIGTFRDIVRVKRCRALIYPQLLRGATFAMTVFVIPFAVKYFKTPTIFGSQMALMGQIGLIAGNLMIVLLCDRLGAGLVVLIGDTIAGVGFALLIAAHGWAMVLPDYALISIGTVIENNAVPLGTFTVIPAAIMGAFSGVRMLLLGMAMALSARVGGHLLDVMNPLIVFAVVAGLKIVNAIWFWWVFRTYRLPPLPSGAAPVAAVPA